MKSVRAIGVEEVSSPHTFHIAAPHRIENALSRKRILKE
jgi:hypothetical protein